MSDLIARLNENIISDAFERRDIVCGVLAERLIRERKEAADRIAELTAALRPFAAIADESTANLADNYMYPDCYPMSAFRAAKAALEKRNV